MLPFLNEIEGTIYYDLDVLLVDTQSGELIAHNWQPVAFYCDCSVCAQLLRTTVGTIAFLLFLAGAEKLSLIQHTSI